MNKLPQKLTLPLMQTQWSQAIDPVITNPTNNKSVLKNVSLITGTNVINHLLGRPLQGWGLTRIRALASIYDTQDTNQTPQLTLNLVSSAPVVVDIEVF